jgi:hypothetical protein
MTEPDINLTSTDQAAAEIQRSTTEGWADDLAQNRCTATHEVTTPAQVSAPAGVVTVRCDGTAGHAGNRHEAHYDDHLVHWAGGLE